MARFVESWTNSVLHGAMRDIALMDIHDALAPADQHYFRTSREARMGVTLEKVAEGREAALKALPATLMPLRLTLKSQPWIGGSSPLFADYIVFGAFQWVRVTAAGVTLFEEGDPVADWFERCLDLMTGWDARYLQRAEPRFIPDFAGSLGASPVLPMPMSMPESPCD